MGEEETAILETKTSDSNSIPNISFRTSSSDNSTPIKAKWSRALEEFQNSSLRSSLRALRATLDLGFAYAQMGKLDEAIASLQKAAEIDKKDPRPHINMGVLMAQQNKFQDGIKAEESTQTGQHLRRSSRQSGQYLCRIRQCRTRSRFI